MAAELPESALKALQRGVPADKVLMPHVELSPRERQFVQRMAEGAGKREAFIEAFEPGGTSRSVSTAAWKVAKRPEVQQALAQQQAVERLRYSQNPLQIRSFVVDSLQHEARTAQRPADRLRALELLGKLADVGAFETRSVVEHRSASDTKAKLAAKLQRLVIDVDATRTDARTDGHAYAQAGEADPTPGEGAQSGGVLGGGPRSNNPHEQFTDSPNSSDGVPPDETDITPRGVITGEEAPYEEGVGSHEGEGVKKKKKERPIWEDPKRWYAETMGEVPKIEWAPREDAREEVQKRLRDDEGGG
jgi:hypothetical protein